MTSSAVARPDASPPSARLRLGQVLLDSGVLAPADLERALLVRAEVGEHRRLGQVLHDLGLVTERQLAGALAQQHGMPLLDLDQLAGDPELVRLIPRAVAERYEVLPYARRANALLVAVADPVDIVALDDIRALTGVATLDPGVATASQIRATIATAWAAHDDTHVVRDFIHELRVDDADAPPPEADAATDAATIRLVDRLIAHAARLHASDIHVEPQRDGVRVRLRVDGALREIMTLPGGGFSAVAARLKIIAELDVIERRVPQDGRARVRVDGQVLDIRMSTLPSLHGEKVVVRLLPSSAELPSLESLGLAADQRALLLEVLARPQGLVLVTGPTGSGKTNTLYAALNEGIDVDRNVITLEDPVEIELPGLTQVPVDEKTGMSFARGLRASLRQDPDVILVGEIRDRETADLAVRASLTGHLVLSTLHTLDAAAAVTRLLDMGVPSYLVTSSLALVVSQRLVRRPCPECCEPDQPPASLLADVGVSDPAGSWVRAVGCHACADTGYHGRTAVAEMLPVVRGVRRTLLEGGGERAVRVAAREAGIPSLLGHAVEVARRGDTTLAEVLRAVPRGDSDEVDDADIDP